MEYKIDELHIYIALFLSMNNENRDTKGCKFWWPSRLFWLVKFANKGLDKGNLCKY